MYPIDFFFRASKLYPERIALQSTTLTLTYRELASKVNALASALQAIDPQPQTRVAICAANTVDHATAILAVLAAGKVWVPLNARSTASEIKRITDTIEPSIVMSDAKGAELLEASSATWLRLDDSGSALNQSVEHLVARHADQVPSTNEAGENATQAIKFTGGTTGLPKGVMQPYRAWTAGIINQVSGCKISEEVCFVF